MPPRVAAALEPAAAPNDAAQHVATAELAYSKTDEAIKLEVKRVAHLSRIARTRLGTRYTQAESIWKALEADNTVLLRASWLLRQRAQSGGRLPRRGGVIPQEALIGGAELKKIHECTRFKDGEVQALPIIAISHCWRTKSDPDPDGLTLDLITHALGVQWDDFASRGVADMGVFFDYSSLFQVPRTAAQNAAFKISLGAINLWYAHALTTVWIVPVAAAATESGKSYHERGWTTFEYQLAMMIKPSNLSELAAWCQLLDLGSDESSEDGISTDFQRPPPAEPLAFFEGHACGDKTYTSGSDRDALVAPKFQRTILELLGGIGELSYERLGWGDDQVVALSRVLPLCSVLRALRLEGNLIGDRGAQALAHVLGQGATPLLQDLDLRDNRIGLDGMQAIATALSRGRSGLALQRLRMRLEDNPGDPRVAYDALGRQLHLLDRPITTWCMRSSKRAALARIYFWGPPRSPSIITLQFDNSVDGRGRKPFEYMEGMMIWLQCPAVDSEGKCFEKEWHPAFITSAPDEPVLEINLAIMPSSHAWSQHVAQYLCTLDPHAEGEVQLHSRNMKTGVVSLGKVLGPDGRPFFRLSSPRFRSKLCSRRVRSPAYELKASSHAPSRFLYRCAPLRWAMGDLMATWIASFRTMVLVSTGVGCTPQASLLKGLISYRWKKGYSPNHLHFIWLVDYSSLLDYKWMLLLLPELKRAEITHNLYYDGGGDQASQLEARIKQLEEQKRQASQGRSSAAPPPCAEQPPPGWVQTRTPAGDTYHISATPCDTSSTAPSMAATDLPVRLEAELEAELARLRSAWVESTVNSRTLTITIFLTGHPARRVAGAARHADLQPSRSGAPRPGSSDELISSLLAVADPATSKPCIDLRSGQPSWDEELGRLSGVARRFRDQESIGVLACGMPAGSTLKHACQAHQLEYYDQVL